MGAAVFDRPLSLGALRALRGKAAATSRSSNVPAGSSAQAARWLPGRALTVVADSGYAAIELLAWCQRLPAPVTLITRLRLDAALYEPAPARAAAQKGRPRRKGRRLPTLAQRLTEPDTDLEPGARALVRRRLALAGSRQRHRRVVPQRPAARGPALGAHPRSEGQVRAAGAALHGCRACQPRQIVNAFVRRWAMEVTFQEARAHLGVEGQRQWNDLAIARSTPLRLALFSLVTLLVHRQPELAGFRAAGGVVQKGVAHLLGCARSSPPLPLAATGFLHVSR